MVTKRFLLMGGRYQTVKWIGVENSEFTFRRGYSYLCEEIDGKTYVMTVDKEIRLELDEEDMKWVEEV